MTTRTIDHVALWVADRDAIADGLERELGLRVIERTDRFTLMGADARRFKLTLFVAEGPREQGALKHVTLRYNDADERELDLGEGLRVTTMRTEAEKDADLDHVALYSRDPEATAREYLSLGFEEAAPRDGIPRVQLGGAYIEFHEGDPDVGERPLLNHVAVLVDRAEDAKDLPADIADVVDAANTVAVFLWGPEGVKLEYVEHKPTFSLV